MPNFLTSLRLAGALVLAAPMFSQSYPVLISNVNGLANVLPPRSACSGRTGLACAIPNLYGPFGLVLPSSNHAAHFNSTFQSNFSALDTPLLRS